MLKSFTLLKIATNVIDLIVENNLHPPLRFGVTETTSGE